MKKTSIVLLNWNTASLLKKSAQLVKDHTQVPHELILVDNGSADGSADVIKRLEDDNTHGLFLKENLGYAGGNNQGIQAAMGDVICLLNSDAFVTKNWLSSLLSCMSQTGAGLVGPLTDNAKGCQGTTPLMRLWPKFLLNYKHVDYLSFFCVLIDAAVFNRIGYLDESFGLGTYEDDDFCRRASLAGFPLVVDRKCWVWHQGHATMEANNIQEKDLLAETREIYREKWNIRSPDLRGTRVSEANDQQ